MTGTKFNPFTGKLQWLTSISSASRIILKKSTATEDIQTAQVVGWDAEEVKDNDFSHDNVTNNERITINSNGTYIIIGTINTVNTGAARATGYMNLRVNGADDPDTRVRNYSRGAAYGDFSLLVATLKVLNATDYIDLYVGIDDADQSDAVNTVVSQSEFMVVKINAGEKGDIGATGSPGDITWQGDWSAGTYTVSQAVTHNGTSYVATTTTSQEPPDSDWDIMAEKGAQGDPGSLTSYMFPVWAEENAALVTGGYEWAFGNGADSALDDGVTIYVPSGFTCTVVAMSLRLGTTPTAITVELGLNGVLQGSNCDVTCTGVRSATNDSFTPVAISNGEYIVFRTTSVSGSTAGPNVVTAWLKMTAV